MPFTSKKPQWIEETVKSPFCHHNRKMDAQKKKIQNKKLKMNFLSIFLKRKSLNFFIMIAIFFWFEDSCQTDVFSMILIVVLRDVFFMDFIIIKNRKSCWWWEGWELSVQKRQESHLLSSMVGRRVENA